MVKLQKPDLQWKGQKDDCKHLITLQMYKGTQQLQIPVLLNTNKFKACTRIVLKTLMNNYLPKEQ